MKPSDRRAWLVFALGVATVPLAGAVAAVARSTGIYPEVWPVDMAVLVCIAAFISSVRLRSAPMAFAVGVLAVTLPYVLFSTAAAMAVAGTLGALLFLAAIAGEALAWVCLFATRQIGGAGR